MTLHHEGMSKPLARIALDPSSLCCPLLPEKVAGKLRVYAPKFKALADETRLEIMALLAAAEEDALCACHIESQFDLSQPTTLTTYRKGAALYPDGIS